MKRKHDMFLFMKQGAMGVRGPQGPRGPTGPRVSINTIFMLITL